MFSSRIINNTYELLLVITLISRFLDHFYKYYGGKKIIYIVIELNLILLEIIKLQILKLTLMLLYIIDRQKPVWKALKNFLLKHKILLYNKYKFLLKKVINLKIWKKLYNFISESYILRCLIYLIKISIDKLKIVYIKSALACLYFLYRLYKFVTNNKEIIISIINIIFIILILLDWYYFFNSFRDNFFAAYVLYFMYKPIKTLITSSIKTFLKDEIKSVYDNNKRVIKIYYKFKKLLIDYFLILIYAIVLSTFWCLFEYEIFYIISVIYIYCMYSILIIMGLIYINYINTNIKKNYYWLYIILNILGLLTIIWICKHIYLNYKKLDRLILVKINEINPEPHVERGPASNPTPQEEVPNSNSSTGPEGGGGFPDGSEGAIASGLTENSEDSRGKSSYIEMDKQQYASYNINRYSTRSHEKNMEYHYNRKAITEGFKESNPEEYERRIEKAKGYNRANRNLNIEEIERRRAKRERREQTMWQKINSSSLNLNTNNLEAKDLNTNIYEGSIQRNRNLEIYNSQQYPQQYGNMPYVNTQQYPQQYGNMPYVNTQQYPQQYGNMPYVNTQQYPQQYGNMPYVDTQQYPQQYENMPYVNTQQYPQQSSNITYNNTNILSANVNNTIQNSQSNHPTDSSIVFNTNDNLNTRGNIINEVGEGDILNTRGITPRPSVGNMDMPNSRINSTRNSPIVISSDSEGDIRNIGNNTPIVISSNNSNAGDIGIIRDNTPEQTIRVDNDNVLNSIDNTSEQIPNDGLSNFLHFINTVNKSSEQTNRVGNNNILNSRNNTPEQISNVDNNNNNILNTINNSLIQGSKRKRIDDSNLVHSAKRVKRTDLMDSSKK